MDFAELVEEVFILTNRRDRVAETQSAVKAATLSNHSRDFFVGDLYEVGLDLQSAAYIQNFRFRSVIPRWRALKYLRKYEPSTDTPGAMLKALEPENVFDGYSIEKTDICYPAGEYIQIKSSNQQRYYLLGCYRFPDITPDGFSSWIALTHPYAIVYDAAASVFKSIGKDEEASIYKVIAAEQHMAVDATGIIGVGF
jgi:hypothetical protein